MRRFTTHARAWEQTPKINVWAWLPGLPGIRAQASNQVELRPGTSPSGLHPNTLSLPDQPLPQSPTPFGDRFTSERFIRRRRHKAFLLCNYMLLGAASSCIFLTLSLRLLPSPCGLLLFLHVLTAVFSVPGCSSSFTAPATPAQQHNALTAIFQGDVTLLAFTRTSDFLLELQSYVKMVGGLGTAIFILEWAALALTFSLRLDDDVLHHANNWASSCHI